MREWEEIFWFLLSQGVKTRFLKTDSFSNSNLDFHTLPIPCNKKLNQLMAVVNDWVNKTRKVVDSWMGSPFDIWIFRIDPSFEYHPLIPRKSHPHLIIVALA